MRPDEIFSSGGSTRNVLVAVASKHGGTMGIGDAIAIELRTMGIDADVRGMTAVNELGAYDAVVVGSAVYMGKWLPQAVSFIRGHENDLRAVPVWLFSSGPLGVDAPVPPGDPEPLDETMERANSRGHRIFSGRLDKERLGLGERLIAKVVHVPAGDFRDWEAIRAWAREIGEALLAMGADSAATTGTRPAA
jgi:menaquinone-dependent protoporphyrinogen oxidase